MKKKVKDCTIEELEKWFLDNYNTMPFRIDIYCDIVGFYTLEDLKSNKKNKFKQYTICLSPDEEIEV